uniref:Uncharacterized protein n=1 Tax=Parascaris equorum TaxID=6256 RepID=A0A914SH79_PAREQ
MACEGNRKLEKNGKLKNMMTLSSKMTHCRDKYRQFN